MKIQINKNILWSKVFIEQLARLGVKNACISPGSRNTPLTYAIATNKKIKSTVIVDERSSAFFALGCAKQTGSPVLVVTTSGTAVAELYPAIIEAYKTRVPLIICTADRPPYLRNKGANQTINQKDIYKNHIRFFAELPLPEINRKSFSKLKRTTVEAFDTCLNSDRGPVHLNFPFEKPFEPNNHTDIVSDELLNYIWSFEVKPDVKKKVFANREISAIKLLSGKINNYKKGIILCGGGSYSRPVQKQLAELAKVSGYPIVADGSTGLRFCSDFKYLLIDNFSSLCRSIKFRNLNEPEIIIQFGTAPTSISMLDFFSKSKAEKFLIDEFGDWNDPSLTANRVITSPNETICSLLLKNVNNRKNSAQWFNNIKRFNSAAGKIKASLINKQPFPFEGRIVNEIISSLPGKCNLIISNSLPVRDFDSFANFTPKEINVFTNRGASGIDGIISTSLGIASQSELPTYLVIGDLAFYHDLNSLPLGKRHSIPLTIILVNNNGGGIFEHLPISRQKDIFEEFFYTPMNLNYKKIIRGYGCIHYKIKNWDELTKRVKSSNKNGIRVLEIKTNAAKSLLLRKDYYRNTIIKTEFMTDENQDK